MVTRLDSQSKFQMLTLCHYFPAAILVHHRCAPTWRFHTGLCKFLRNISTNTWETYRPKNWSAVFFIYLLQHHDFFNFSTRWFSISLFLVRDKTIYKIQQEGTRTVLFVGDSVIRLSCCHPHDLFNAILTGTRAKGFWFSDRLRLN